MSYDPSGEPQPSPCLISQDLPSGAHFFRTSLAVPGS